jgi:Tol biopolymer transport system component
VISSRLKGEVVVTRRAIGATMLAALTSLAIAGDVTARDTTTRNGKLSFSVWEGSHIASVRADGGARRRLTFEPWNSTFPVKSPDGRWIAYVGDSNGNPDVHVVGADGRGHRRLTAWRGEDAAPAWSPDSARIAFHSDRDGNFELYTMRADGHDVRRLTTNSASDRFPKWSHDGRSIAFHSDRDGDNEVYVMGAGGTGARALTSSEGENYTPAWSPDDRRLAFVGTREGSPDIWTIAANGTGPTQLTSGPDEDYVPSWSPDGSEILFLKRTDTGEDPGVFAVSPGTRRLRLLPAAGDTPSWSRDGTILTSVHLGGISDLHIARVDGSGRAALTTTQDAETSSSWSPDGRRVAYSLQDSQRDDIQLIGADGKGRRRFAPNPAPDFDPDWSPDGRRIAYTSYRGKNRIPVGFTRDTEIVVAGLGGGQVNVSRHPDDDAEPAWSPDGRRIAFARFPPGTVRFPHGDRSGGDIWVMNSDGTGQRRLTRNRGNDESPSWSADGRQIVFASARRGGRLRLWIMDADGGRQRPLTPPGRLAESQPEVSPDGRLVAFTRFDRGHAGVYVAGIDGRGARLVAETCLRGYCQLGAAPSWQPLPAKGKP